MGELDTAKRGAGDISFVAAAVDGLVGLGQAKPAAILMSRLSLEKP